MPGLRNYLLNMLFWQRENLSTELFKIVNRKDKELFSAPGFIGTITDENNFRYGFVWKSKIIAPELPHILWKYQSLLCSLQSPVHKAETLFIKQAVPAYNQKAFSIMRSFNIMWHQFPNLFLNRQVFNILHIFMHMSLIRHGFYMLLFIGIMLLHYF